MVRPTADLVGRAIAGGKLIIEGFVGDGGMGAVYRARHRELGMAVAVKVLHESFQHDVDFSRRFHAEALAASRLSHPNLTRVHDFGQEPDGLLYIAMEFLEGKDLRDILLQDKRLPALRATAIMAQVCAGLTHVHARGMVYNDIKPENLVVQAGVDDEGESAEVVKVCDFGIALGSKERVTAGTPDYMSPERCLGQPLDARSDLYACGVVLYELVAGRTPFSGDTQRVLAQHRRSLPPPPSRFADVPPRLEEVILRSLEKDPEKRQQSARDLRRELRAAMERGPVSSPGSLPPSARAPSPPSSTRAPSTPSEDAPDWLERRAGGTFALVQNASVEAFALDIVQNPTPFLQKLASARDARRLEELLVPLDDILRRLVERRETATLWKMASTLEHIASEGPATPGSRAAVVGSTLRLLSDPQLLSPIAERALAHPDDASAKRLLVRAALGGAHAVYSARVKNRSHAARAAFTGICGEIGAAGLPVFRAALEHLEGRLGASGAVELAEDLLCSLPPTSDGGTEAVVARYTRVPVPRLACTATGVLPHVLGERAHALLVGLLEHPAESVRITATRALREIGETKEHR